MQTVISLPENLTKEVKKQVKQGKFSSEAEFIRSAVETFINFQKGKITWELLASPFRTFAKKNKLKESDVLRVVEEGRYGKASKSS